MKAMDDEQPKKQREWIKIFKPKVIIVLLIVDIILCIVVCGLRKQIVINRLISELNQVTDSEESEYSPYAKLRLQTYFVNGVVTDIDILPNFSDDGLEHQLKWSKVIVHVDSDGEDIPVIFSSRTKVLEVDEYGNVNNNTLSIGNSVEIYVDIDEDTGIYNASVLIRNLNPERNNEFLALFNKAIITDRVVTIICIFLISALGYLIACSIKYYTREYVDIMVFILIFMSIGFIVNTYVYGSSVDSYKRIIDNDRHSYLMPSKFNISYMRIEGEPEYKDSKESIEVVDTFYYFLHHYSAVSLVDYEYFSVSTDGYRFFHNGVNRFDIARLDTKYGYNSSGKINEDIGFQCRVKVFNATQSALYTFDSYVDYYEDYKIDNEIFRSVYTDDDELIVLRKVSCSDMPNGEYREILYVRLCDDVIVVYNFVILDTDTDIEKIEEFDSVLDMIGLEIEKTRQSF